MRGVKRLLCLAVISGMLCSVLGGSCFENNTIIDGWNISKVNAATKSTGTKNMTATVKVKSKSGRKMKVSEVNALSSASFKMLNTVMEKETEGSNVLISPASIQYAFGMAENGAKGTTKKQLEKVINGGIKSSEFNKIMAAYKKRMTGDEYVKWNIANSVWYRNRKDIKVKKTFLKNVKSYYGAQVYRAPFNNSTVKDINSWVNKNTKKMIPKIIDNTDSSAVMYIINAMAFEGAWAEQFDEKHVLENRDFTNYDGSVSKVTMLQGGESSYFELNGAYGFRKMYSGGQYSFVGIEVPEGTTTQEYVKKLSENGSEFVKALKNMKRAKVTLQLPEFDTDYDVEMSDPLKKLGAVNAFNRDKANLYNMFKKDADGNYYFSAVLHKTHIEVDRKGTKAAAVTAIIVNKATSVRTDELENIEITLDHPFVYAIVDNTTNLPVFVGVVNQIK